MVKVHKFTVHGGAKPNPERPGKTVWPDCFHLKISRFHAEDLSRQLLNWLLEPERRDEKEYTYSTMGELEYDIPEE